VSTVALTTVVAAATMIAPLTAMDSHRSLAIGVAAIVFETAEVLLDRLEAPRRDVPDLAALLPERTAALLIATATRSSVTTGVVHREC
jgi:hypothetical protein